LRCNGIRRRNSKQHACHQAREADYVRRSRRVFMRHSLVCLLPTGPAGDARGSDGGAALRIAPKDDWITPESPLWTNSPQESGIYCGRDDDTCGRHRRHGRGPQAARRRTSSWRKADRGAYLSRDKLLPCRLRPAETGFHKDRVLCQRSRPWERVIITSAGSCCGWGDSGRLVTRKQSIEPRHPASRSTARS
jgi:hypothetical protein